MPCLTLALAALASIPGPTSTLQVDEPKETPSKGLVIRGRVVDDRGEPVESFGVGIKRRVLSPFEWNSTTIPIGLFDRRVDPEPTSMSLFTDPRGEFSYKLPTGSTEPVSLVASVGNSTLGVRLNSAPVQVQPGENRYVEFAVERGCVIEGVVRDSAGKPVWGTTVGLSSADWVPGEQDEPIDSAWPAYRTSLRPGRFQRTVVTDFEGRYRFECLRPGAWTLGLARQDQVAREGVAVRTKNGDLASGIGIVMIEGTRVRLLDSTAAPESAALKVSGAHMTTVLLKEVGGTERARYFDWTPGQVLDFGGLRPGAYSIILPWRHWEGASTHLSRVVEISGAEEQRTLRVDEWYEGLVWLEGRVADRTPEEWHDAVGDVAQGFSTGAPSSSTAEINMSEWEMFASLPGGGIVSAPIAFDGTFRLPVPQGTTVALSLGDGPAFPHVHPLGRRHISERLVRVPIDGLSGFTFDVAPATVVVPLGDRELEPDTSWQLRLERVGATPTVVLGSPSRDGARVKFRTVAPGIYRIAASPLRMPPRMPQPFNGWARSTRPPTWVRSEVFEVKPETRELTIQLPAAEPK